MASLEETGIFLAFFGMLGTLLWNIINYIRKPSFVSIAKLDDTHSTILELRNIIFELRTEVTEFKAKNTSLSERVNVLMLECEFWRKQYRDALK